MHDDNNYNDLASVIALLFLKNRQAKKWHTPFSLHFYKAVSALDFYKAYNSTPLFLNLDNLPYFHLVVHFTSCYFFLPKDKIDKIILNCLPKQQEGDCPGCQKSLKISERGIDWEEKLSGILKRLPNRVTTVLIKYLYTQFYN